MNFTEIPFKGRRYNLKRCFALHVKCAQLFLTRNKTYRFSREYVCSVRYEILENSSNLNRDVAEKIQLSAGKVPLVIKQQILTFITTNVRGMPDMYFQKHPSHGS